MTRADFRKLDKRDFDNGAVLNEIDDVFKERDALRAENARLAAIEQRAQLVIDGEAIKVSEGRLPYLWQPLYSQRRAASYILNGTPAPEGKTGSRGDD